MLVPQTSRAIQLHWSTGATDLSFASARRCSLIVKADTLEETLPSQWRVLWLADSTGVNFVPDDSVVACRLDFANVSSIDGPSTPADSAAHVITAHFCSEGTSASAIAFFLIDQPGGSKGRLKIIAIDPTDPDSARVIESNEVTYNGGVEGAYAPVILRAGSAHDTGAEIHVTAVGTGLSSADALTITAPDHLWSVPLTIAARTDSTLTAWAIVPAPLPAAVIELQGSSGAVSIGSLGADQITTADASMPDTILFRDPNWSPTFSTSVYPKDFAFFCDTVPTGNPQNPWRLLLHLVYIRHNNNYAGDAAESLLAHAWSTDLRNWHVDKRAFSPNYGSPTAWDQKHVWAPSIAHVGNLYYMFYTGVDANGNQNIGYVTTALLDTSDTVWSASRTMCYSAGQTGWADPTGQGFGNPGQQQFRDPFVMPDPDNPGRYLMFVTGEDKKFGADGRMIIGGAQNVSGTLAQWTDKGAYRATDFTHTGITRDEAPLVMRDSSGTGAWRIFIGNGDYDSTGTNSTFFATESAGFSVADTTVGRWPGLDNLYPYLGSDNSLIGWEACEHLQIGVSHLFAAYDGTGIGITS